MKNVTVFFNFPRGSNKSYNIFFLLSIIGASGSRVLIISFIGASAVLGKLKKTTTFLHVSTAKTFVTPPRSVT